MQPVPEHISARASDLADLLHGIQAFDQRTRQHGFDPVVSAASLAFGFVYVHPFEDGNGRLHRWIIHHVLAANEFTPPNVVFPISSVMLRKLGEYQSALRSYSERMLPLVDWTATPTGNVEVRNDTSPYYRFFDATRHAEFLYECVGETVEHDLPNEVAYLEAYDRFVNEVNAIADMPAKTSELLHRYLRQNAGKLSERARSREFAALTPDEVARVEDLYARTTGAVTVSVGVQPEMHVKTGKSLDVELLVSRPDAAGADVASIQVEVTWDPAMMSLTENSAGDWIDAHNSAPATAVVNDSHQGRLIIGAFVLAGSTKPFALRRFAFKPLRAGTTAVDVLVVAIGTTLGRAVPSRTRNLRIVIDE
jgi:hypothetical protein